MTISDFTIDVDAATLQDLHDRLARTRWPQKETVEDWGQGIPLNLVQELCGYWLNEYDWPSRQRQLNAFDHFLRTESGFADSLEIARRSEAGEGGLRRVGARWQGPQGGTPTATKEGWA